MMHDLKPCPFCGGDATLEQNFELAWQIWCANENCTVLSETAIGSELDSIAAWNRRADDCRPLPKVPSA